MSGWGPVKLRPLAGFLLYSARRRGLRTTFLTDVVTCADGDTLDVPGSPRVVHLPRHTPGSVALHVPSADAVFMGDAYTTRSVLTGQSGPRPAPFTLQPAEARAALARLDDIHTRRVLPGHGPAWNAGLAEALRLIRLAG